MKPQIMIIDDTDEQLKLMKVVFNIVAPKLKIATASSGEDALLRMRSDPDARPSVVLLDLRMPGKNGIATLEEMKSDQDLKNIPVCMFSNGDLQRDICDCYARGASLYFRKPVGLEALRQFAKEFGSIWFQWASHCACLHD